MQSTCRLAWGVISDRKEDRGVFCDFSIFRRGWECICVYVCVYAHTHMHCTWGSRCEPRGREEKRGVPEESRWTESWRMCIRICVLSTHVYICVRTRDEILD